MMIVRSAADLDLGAFVRPGDGIIVGQGTGEPLTLTEKLVEQRAAYSGASLFFSTAFSSTFQPAHADHLRFRGIGGIGSLRKLTAAKVLEVVPCHYSSVEPLIVDGTIRSDVVLLQVSPANERGEHSFGLVNDVLRAAIKRARVVIAEVNEQVPWTPCDAPLREDEITLAVHTDRPLLELPRASFGELERCIARHLVDVIPDGATLQVGIGAVPEAIVATLADRRGLGVHSGIVGDAIMDLMKAGVVTNANKGVDAGVTIAGMLFGTRELYRFANRNTDFRLVPSSVTHGILSLSHLQKFTSINSALEVDLTGQVNAEAIGADHLGAVGGQVDFIRGAALSPGGVSIIALPSTGKDGRSRIVAHLNGPVTTARSDVDFVATEHGVAALRGKSLSERVRALVDIAAPEHREDLRRDLLHPKRTT